MRRRLLLSTALVAAPCLALAQVAPPPPPITLPGTAITPPATPAGQQQLITNTPWINGRGALSGPAWRDKYQIIHDILNGMGTWDPVTGKYILPSATSIQPGAVVLGAPGGAAAYRDPRIAGAAPQLTTRIRADRSYNVYVNAQAGKDQAGCGSTQATACQTRSYAFTLVQGTYDLAGPLGWNGVNVLLEPGTYTDALKMYGPIPGQCSPTQNNCTA